MKILIIDDDTQLLKMLSITIEANIPNVKVLNALNAEEGINIFETNKDVDLVITDIVLPDKAGISVIVKIRQLNPNIPIFAMSGDSRIDTSEYLELSSKLGAKRTFHKPINRSLIIKEIKSVLGI